MIAESPRANWYKTKNCDIYTVGNLGERYYGLAVKRSGSPSADIKTLSDKILQLQASGKMTQLIDRYFGDSKCYRKVFFKNTNNKICFFEVFCEETSLSRIITKCFLGKRTLSTTRNELVPNRTWNDD